MKIKQDGISIPKTLFLGESEWRRFDNPIPTFFSTKSVLKYLGIKEIKESNVTNLISKIKIGDVTQSLNSFRMTITLFFIDGQVGSMQVPLESILSLMNNNKVIIDNGEITMDFKLVQEKKNPRLVLVDSKEYKHYQEESEKSRDKTSPELVVGDVIELENRSRTKALYLGEIYGASYNGKEFSPISKRLAILEIDNSISNKNKRGVIVYSSNKGNMLTTAHPSNIRKVMPYQLRGARIVDKVTDSNIESILGNTQLTINGVLNNISVSPIRMKNINCKLLLNRLLLNFWDYSKSSVTSRINNEDLEKLNLIYSDLTKLESKNIERLKLSLKVESARSNG